MTQTTPLGVRISPELKEALQRAAEADHRSFASLVEKVLNDWARDNGHLAQTPAARRPKAARAGAARKK